MSILQIKRYVILSVLWMMTFGLWAQTDDLPRNMKHVEQGDSLWGESPSSLMSRPEVPAAEVQGISSVSSVLRGTAAPQAEYNPSFTLPTVSYASRYLFRAPWGLTPYGWYGSPFGDVHTGLNASLTAGVSVGLGRNNPYRGALFFTGISALYAHPINDRWTLAVGADYLHTAGWGSNTNNVSLYAMANYRINDKLDFTGFLSHSFGPFGADPVRLNPMACGIYGRYPYGTLGPSTTIGGELGIKVGENSKISFGLSFTREENPQTMPPRPNQGIKTQ